MNPPAARPASRLVRGRARGGGYRPYFYFRRNGRTIPAGSGNTEQSTERWGTGNVNHTFSANRGGRYGRKRRSRQSDDSGILPPLADSTFLRPEHYAAPEDALQVQSLAVDTLVQCPGWSLYFPTEKYKEPSEVVKRIKVLQTHYNSHLLYYDLSKIQNDCNFLLQARIVMSDESVTQAWPSLLEDLKTRPLRTVATFGVAMYSNITLAAIDASVSQQASNLHLYVPRACRPRKIYARPVGFTVIDLLSQVSNAELDKLFCVRGSVLAVGAVEAAASWVAFKCTRCTQEQAIKQNGYHPCRPFACKREGCLAKSGFVEQRCSPYTRIRPAQIIRLAENHLQAVLDLDLEMPEYIDIEIRQDLVDSLYCGQDCIITGVLKMRPLTEEQEYQRNGLQPNAKSGLSQLYLKALSTMDPKMIGHSLAESDLDAISAINGEQDSFKMLVHSLAPEIHGQELVKAGLLLSLFGGSGSQIHNESEINVLLVGDPGIGKSHLLQMCSKVSEKGNFVNNKRGATTGQQLVTSIHGRTNYSINAGPLIASRNGHCSIDDIDRLGSQQETLLQLMQTHVTALPFPNIFTTLTIPASVIATANSMRGHYDHSKTLVENIRINPSLLSQFHLVFVLMDRPNKDLDNDLTEHIKALHAGTKKNTAIAARFDIKPKTNNSLTISEDEVDANDENYDLGERLKVSTASQMDGALDLVPFILMKKFILYARQQIRPLLTPEAADALKEFYLNLRKETNTEKCQAISTSQLEGLIRLAQARARIDFSAEATKAHVRDVLCIVRHSIADTSVGDYIDTNPADAATGNKRGSVKKFIQMLQARSNALSRRIFEFDELKDMARHAGISCGVTNLVDVVNMQGYLLKKGPNLYEVMTD